jgi:acetyl-CoA carboxylase biotin carboxylase subunit
LPKRTVKPPQKVLVVNRGEIAVRVMRTCRELGVTTVAVYSDLDRAAAHVRYADEAYALGGQTAAESYLNTEAIIGVIRRAGVDGVHPGYGFFAENADFARAIAAEGVAWIGPPPEAIEIMGDKIASRKAVAAAGVEAVPGTLEPIAGADDVLAFGEAHGWPVAIKAAHGGGGKGMKVVAGPDDAQSALDSAAREAQAYFGRSEAYLERYLTRPRHIEVQVFCDTHGNAVSLGERDCSTQRRHQKLIEESPSPVVDAAARERLGELAVSAMRAVGYVNAGTVEFLRAQDGTFYFMEVNARLQVEHAVTEEVFGVDLVRLQIAIAAGARLPFGQDAVVARGHAIECRILAEDPARGFLPSPGTISRLRVPSGPGIRHDGGTYDGWTVPLHYDPMLAKLVAWGATREMAISRMARALHEYRVEGPATCIGFHRRVLAHPAFLRGDLHTGFLDEHKELLTGEPDPEFERVAAIAAAVAQVERRRAPSRGNQEAQGATGPSAWRRASRWGWRP